MRSRPRLAALCLLPLLAGGCARLVTPRRPPLDANAASILAALAAREQGLQGLRLSMRVRATGAGVAAALASPAYLAIDGPENLRLQVLSPFGVTLLDLVIAGDDYTLRAPARGQVEQGHIDPASLDRPETSPGERLIVALALVFRPRIDAASCRVLGASATAPPAVTCPIAHGLEVTSTLDDYLRPVRETYAYTGGAPWLEAEYDEYPEADPTALPGRIVIRDPNGDTALIARVQSATREARR